MATPLSSGPATPTGPPPTDLAVPLNSLDLLSIDPASHRHSGGISPSPTASTPPHFSHLAPPGRSVPPVAHLPDGTSKHSLTRRRNNPNARRYTRHPGDFPPEIIALIIHHYYYAELPYPQHFPNPDPYLVLLPATPWHPPRLAPPLDVQAKDTLAALCLVNKTWSAEATRALWRRVSFGMPRAFESVLRTIEEYSGGQRVARPLRSDLRRWTSLGGGGGGGSGSGSSSERSMSRGREVGHRQTGSLGLIGTDAPPPYSPLSLLERANSTPTTPMGDPSDFVTPQATPLAEKQDVLQLGGPWAAAGAALASAAPEGAKTGEPVELTGASHRLPPALPLMHLTCHALRSRTRTARPRPPDPRPLRVPSPLHPLHLVRPLPHSRHEAHTPSGVQRALRHARAPPDALWRDALPAREARLPCQARS